jgi:hypothetical protein
MEQEDGDRRVDDGHDPFETHRPQTVGMTGRI